MSFMRACHASVSSAGTTPCTVTPGVSGSVARPPPMRIAPRSSRNRPASGTIRSTALARSPKRTSAMRSAPGAIRLSMPRMRAVPLVLPKGGGRSIVRPVRSLAMCSVVGLPFPPDGMSRVAFQAASPRIRARAGESSGIGFSARPASWSHAASRRRVRRPLIDTRVAFGVPGEAPMRACIGSPSQVAVMPSESTAAFRNAIRPFTAAIPGSIPGPSSRLWSSAIVPSATIDRRSPFRGISSFRSMVLSPCIAKVSIIGANRPRRGLSARKRTALALAPSTRPSTRTTGTSALTSSMVTVASRMFDLSMRPDSMRASNRAPANRTTADTLVTSGQPWA